MMRLTSIISLFSATMLLQACGGDDSLPEGTPSVAPITDQSVAAGATTTYTITGLDDAQAYRVTLVVADNVTASDVSATFLDNDQNGAADAGASEGIALITRVNGEVVTGAKTVPGGTDDPANPSGIFPMNGQITVDIMGISAGTVYPVAYENGGASTFLEIDGSGAPIETYGVGGALTVSGASGNPVVLPAAPQSLAIDGTVDYTIFGLKDEQAYRITLVVGDNVNVVGTQGAFLDNDANGAADAGASEDIAVITAVNGDPVTGTKTVPGGTDDPANPSGIFPVNGKIELTITGAGAGTVQPVAYENGGASTFLEIDGNGAPVEVYSIGGSITVQ